AAQREVVGAGETCECSSSGCDADDPFAIIGDTEQHIETDPLVCACGEQRRIDVGLAVQTHGETSFRSVAGPAPWYGAPAVGKQRSRERRRAFGLSRGAGR